MSQKQAPLTRAETMKERALEKRKERIAEERVRAAKRRDAAKCGSTDHKPVGWKPVPATGNVKIGGYKVDRLVDGKVKRVSVCPHNRHPPPRK